MDHRRKDVDHAHANTCNWITLHRSYIEWLEEGSGILWIKGVPGSGKSTLMAHLFRDLNKQSSYQRSIKLSFFFHGRGTDMQKSRLGMFRSLLHQLLLCAPDARDEFQHEFDKRCQSYGRPGKDWEWHVNELRDFLFSAVEKIARTQSVSIFIDALDEAIESTDDRVENHKIVSDLHALNELLHSPDYRSTICFSCRHFPVITTSQRWEVWVEKENHVDISLYVRDELQMIISPSAADRKDVEQWHNIIATEARGVFQWAVLVVKMTIKYQKNGRSQKDIRQMLRNTPRELSDIYKHILTELVDEDDQKKSLRLMRWVLLAKRPLTLTEACFAMCLSDTEAPVTDLTFDEMESTPHDSMVKQITSLSGGLVECKLHQGDQILQFIHQSVNDFLLKSGMGILDSASSDKPIGKGHHQLSVICANYVRLANSVGLTETKHPEEKDSSAIKLRYPFVKYAVKFWFYHAEMAETLGVSQAYLISFSQHDPSLLRRWVMFYRALKDYEYSRRRPENESTMLHIACDSNLSSVVKDLLSQGFNVEQTDSVGNRALHYASRRGHVSIVKELLDAGATLEAENLAKRTALEQAAAYGHEDVVVLLLKAGASIETENGENGQALSSAVKNGNINVVRILLQYAADVNAQGGEYGNALQSAAFWEREAIVCLLLDEGAEVNAQGGHYGNALQAAAYKGHQAIIQLLLDRGAEINAQGGSLGNALQAAAAAGIQAVVQLLLDSGAEVNAQSGHLGNALQAAAVTGNQAIIQLLLDSGAEVNAQGGFFGNALQAAADGGNQAIVQLLLDRGAEINAQGGSLGNALQAAAVTGNQAIVQLLLDSGAEVNAQGGHYGNALQAAADGGNQAIVQLLLDSGAEVNAQGGHLGNALQAAADGGNQAVVQLLLDWGAEVNAQGGHYGNALQAAAVAGNQAIIQLLLDSGAEVNAQCGSFGNALQAATYNGNQEIVQLLLKYGADFNAQVGPFGNAL